MTYFVRWDIFLLTLYCILHLRKWIIYLYVFVYRCVQVCRVCNTDKCAIGRTIKEICSDCNMICRTSECYRLHSIIPSNNRNGKYVSKSQCRTFVKCMKCTSILERSNRNLESHVCGEWLCKYCKCYFHGTDHHCYTRICEPKEKCKKFIHFDYECSQDSGEHLPNFVIAHTTCELCIDDDELSQNYKCSGCGVRCNACNIRSKDGEYLNDPCLNSTGSF